jgi:hypothetical protein
MLFGGSGNVILCKSHGITPFALFTANKRATIEAPNEFGSSFLGADLALPSLAQLHNVVGIPDGPILWPGPSKVSNLEHTPASLNVDRSEPTEAAFPRLFALALTWR